MENKNIYQRMLAIMEDVKNIEKTGSTGQYPFASHNDVTKKVAPALIKNGVMALPTVDGYTRDGSVTECAITMKFINVDKPEEIVEVKSFGYGVDNQDKGPGKAMSYAVKYAFLKALCLSTGKDDVEHDNIEAEPQKERRNITDIIKSLPKPLTDMIHKLIKEERTTGGAMNELVLDTHGDPMLISTHIEERFAVQIQDTETVNKEAAEQLEMRKRMGKK